MPTTATMPDLSDILHLVRIALAFGLKHRVTLHPDGVTPESDTDHTVMLALLAPALAAKLRPDLSSSLVAAFAVVHDLPEVKVGDTNTLGISEKDRAAKRAREMAAQEELQVELQALPWISQMLARYEAQDAPEARWVRYLDKVLPKLTHVLNHGAAMLAMPHLVDQGAELHEVVGALHAKQQAALAEEYPEFPELGALLAMASDAAVEACRTRPA